MSTPSEKKNELCPNCGEEALKLYQDVYRGEYFCDACRMEYWEEQEEAEGDNFWALKN